MDIAKLFNVILQISIGCVFAYLVFNFLRKKKKDGVCNEIKNLEARMSSLRLILKAKVKRKSQYFRSLITATVRQGDIFDLALCELAELSFEQNEQFEKYFSISKQLNNLLKVDRPEMGEIVAPENSSGNQGGADFMTNDFKNEFVIIKAIHEMIDLSIVLKTKIDQYNIINPEKSRPEIKIIQFPSVCDVQKVFSIHSSDISTEKTAA